MLPALLQIIDRAIDNTVKVSEKIVEGKFDERNTHLNFSDFVFV